MTPNNKNKPDKLKTLNYSENYQRMVYELIL